MNKDLLLMSKDNIVMRINFELGIFDVVNENLLPFDMKGKIVEIPSTDTLNTQYGRTQWLLAANKCSNAIMTFLAHRVLPISRTNAKKIYNLFGFSQLQDDISKSKVAIVCRAVSLQDTYWLKSDGSTKTWDDVDIRKNSLSEVVAQVSLHGSSLSLQDKVTITPELTGQGAYAKAWKREDGELWLHKYGANSSWESKIEVMVSNILDRCNVDHLPYEMSTSYDAQLDETLDTCRCKCMTDDTRSILSGMDFTSWCIVNGKDPIKEALNIDAEMIYKMSIVDYLISNRDRHGLNWGFFYNPDTMEISGCHLLYDHNNSFDIALMQDPDAPYLYDNSMSMRNAAKRAMNNVDFHFTAPITRDLFLTDRQYKSFMSRAEELGVKTNDATTAIKQ